MPSPDATFAGKAVTYLTELHMHDRYFRRTINNVLLDALQRRHTPRLASLVTELCGANRSPSLSSLRAGQDTRPERITLVRHFVRDGANMKSLWVRDLISYIDSRIYKNGSIMKHSVVAASVLKNAPASGLKSLT